MDIPSDFTILDALRFAALFNKAAEQGQMFEVIMPNGKRFGDCTGREIGVFGEWLTSIAQSAKAAK